MATILSPHTYLMPVRTPLWATATPIVADTPGQLARWVVTFLSGTSPGNTIRLIYGDQSILFTSFPASELDLNPNQFKTDGNAAQSAIYFFNACGRNYVISRDFVVTVAGVNVTFTQRTPQPPDSPTPNTYFDLISVATNPPSGMAGGDTLVAASAGSLVQNHSLRVAVHVEMQPGVFVRQPEESCSIIAGQDPAINLQGILRPFLEPDLPDYNIPLAQLKGIPAPGVFRRFFLETVEFHGVPPAPLKVEKKGSVDIPLTAWLAGFQQEDHEAAHDFTSQITFSSNKLFFLTYRGRYARTTVTKSQRHYLSHYCWYTPQTSDQAQLQVRITCTDGTLVDWTTRYQEQTGAYVKRTITIWAAGYDHLSLDSLVPPGKVAARYDVRLKASFTGLVISETKTFHLVEPDYQQVDLLFLNSVGGYDPIRATGAWSEMAEHDFMVTERPAVPSDYGDPMARRGATIPLGGERHLNLQTGWSPLSEHRCIADVLNSPDIRIVDTARLCYKRVRIVKSAQVQLEARGDDDENLYALQLDLVIADVEEVITRPFPLPPPPPPVVPPMNPGFIIG